VVTVISRGLAASTVGRLTRSAQSISDTSILVWSIASEGVNPSCPKLRTARSALVPAASGTGQEHAVRCSC